MRSLPPSTWLITQLITTLVSSAVSALFLETWDKALIFGLVAGSCFGIPVWASLELKRQREEQRLLRVEMLQSLVPLMEELQLLMRAMPLNSTGMYWLLVPIHKVRKAKDLIAELEHGFDRLGIGVPRRHYPRPPHYPHTILWEGTLREVIPFARRGDIDKVENWMNTLPLPKDSLPWNTADLPEIDIT